MLKTPLSAAEIQNALELADSELLFLMDDGNIPKDVQAKDYEQGYSDPVVFAKLEDSAEEARKIFRNDLDLDDSRRGPKKALVARLMAV